MSLHDPSSSSDGDAVPSLTDDHRQRERERVKVTKHLFLLEVKLGSRRVFVHNVSWKVNVWTLSELSYFAEV